MQASQSLDVQAFFNAHRLSPYQWLIFSLCFMIVLFDGFDTAAIGYIAPSLLGEWGLEKQQLAPVLSAALLGLAGGALSAGPLADRLGRKRVLLAAVLLFGAASLASAYASSLDQLTVLRFVTGLGLGAAMPNAVTLTSEYCPDRQRSMLTNAMFCGFPLGSACGGFLASWMIPHWGWRSVLLLGGIAPLVLLLLMLAFLPESVRYMVAKGQPAQRIRRILMRISTGAAHASAFVFSEKKPVAGGHTGLRVVLSRHYRLGSLMLWLAYFMGLVIIYALINWMPVLLKESGMASHKAILVSALFPLGGVGAVLLGWLMDRYNANRIIAIGYALTAVSIYLIGQVVGQDGWLVVMVFVAGTIMNTAQSSMPALAAAFYPTQGRATGVAWMLGIGRFGGIAGSFLVAELTVRQLGFSQIFTVMAVPGVVAAVALLFKKQQAHPESDTVFSAKPGGPVSAH